MEALAQLLTRESVLIELLVFKLTELRQLLLSGETRFLGWASEEVDRATAAVRDAELERAVLVMELGSSRGLPEPSLRELLEDAPEPWQGLLQELHEQMRRHALESAALLQSTRRLAEAGSRSIHDTLASLNGGSTQVDTPAPTYNRVQARYGTGS